MTFTPRSTAICTTVDPTPPAAPLTSSVSPGLDADLVEDAQRRFGDRRVSGSLLEAEVVRFRGPREQDGVFGVGVVATAEDSVADRYGLDAVADLVDHAAAITQNPEAPHTAVATGALASFVLDAFSLSRETDEPEVAVEEIFRMIDAAWRASALATSAQPTATSSANGH